MIAPGSKLGSYEVLSLLGAGGMGEVYRARDTRLGRTVAIKVLSAERMADENRRRRFVQEARAASALNHPNIVTIYEIESANGIDFIVMEYVDGKTLDAIIPHQGMKLGDVLRVAIPIADAMARAHTAGIVHRDLKPANIVVGSDGVVKILDFGLAKLVTLEPGGPDHATVSEDGDAGPLSRSGMVAGTAGYMSPEQATGKEVDSRSDVFSFGAVLYEMVTGRRAFAGNSTAETLAAVLREQPKAPSELGMDVPRDLEKLILRCLQKDLSRRFQHMQDVRIELQEVKDESESGSAATAAGPVRRGRLRWAIGLTGAVLALAIGAWLLWRSRGAAIPQPLVVSLTSTPGRETEPTFSPDGNQVAFAWEGEKLDNWDIYIKMVGSPEARRLTADPAVDRLPSWSPDGRQIAFIRTARQGETGTIQLISPLGGADRKLTDLPAAFGRLSWSPDGRWLATAPIQGSDEPNDIRGIRFINVANGEARTITSPTPPTYHSDAAFSPDGHHLAYASCHRLFMSCQIEVVELGADYVPTGAARRLTRTIIWMGGLTWARDGKAVVYKDLLNGRLWRLGVGGEQPPERIEVAGSDALGPTIALTRDRLAFERLLSANNVYRFEPGRPPTAVAASSLGEWNPHFSPDGRRFVFESGRGGEGEEIWLAAVDGSNPMQLTHGPGVHQGSPRWSPDGRRIAFDSQGADGHFDIWTIGTDGASLRRFTTDPGDEIQPSWSRDGRWIYFASDREGAVPDTWRALAMGGPEERVSRGGGHLSQESVDGKTLFFLRDVGESSRLMALPLAGGPERKVLDCVGGDGFAVGPAGLYRLGCTARWRAGPVPLYLMDAATGRDRLLGTLEAAVGEMTVSPDGKTILYTKHHMSEGSDLMLIENFR